VITDPPDYPPACGVSRRHEAEEPAVSATDRSAARSAEAQRLAAVGRFEILDTPRDGAFDRIAALAARLLDTPIATVTIVDEDRIWFKAAHGLDGVTQIGRDPGLCASAIQNGAPYVINDALRDPRTAANPLVHGELGIQFYAAAPITTPDGYRLGTVCVLDTHPREISAADLATLQDLAAVVMEQLELRLAALRTVRIERELREQADQHRGEIEVFASTLQQTLLPPTLPHVPGLELACHYYTASRHNVGGDFYDVFSLPDGRWAFFLGDVCGHGAPAAALTSLTRYTLRSAAAHDPDPITVLTELNTALLNDPVARCRFATVVFGVLDPDPEQAGTFTVTLGTGGHEPPLKIVARAAGAGCDVTEVRAATTGMLVGAVPDAEFAVCQVRLEPGQALLLHTDGLTETPVDDGQFGEEGLARLLTRERTSSAHSIVGSIVARIDEFAPAPKDDIALLALSVPPLSG
jgi:sigma-B regulation protein RsbU (phosphoserine phosphatase)